VATWGGSEGLGWWRGVGLGWIGFLMRDAVSWWCWLWSEFPPHLCLLQHDLRDPDKVGELLRVQAVRSRQHGRRRASGGCRGISWRLL
jgi:hypothetical protein